MKEIYKRNFNSSNRGYTLIELMIVVALVAILSSVAFASYTDQVRKARRSTAADDTLECAAILERRYTATNSYSNTGNTAVTACDVIDNPDYTITVLGEDELTINSQKRYDEFTITTTASSAAMLGDESCRKFTYNELGEKTATKSDGSTLNTAVCWREQNPHRALG